MKRLKGGKPLPKRQTELPARHPEEAASKRPKDRKSLATRQTEDPDHASSPEPTSRPTKQKKTTPLRRRECTVCSEQVPSNQFPRMPHRGAGEHGRSVCFKCWEAHLGAEIAAKAWDRVACSQCDAVLDEAELRRLASSSDHRR